MESILKKRCYNHSEREAVGLCRECGSFYCRECITEHDDRLICSDCLKKTRRSVLTKNKYSGKFIFGLQCVTGFFVSWIFFYYSGKMVIFISDLFAKEFWFKK